jgi:hypothetical protein
MRLRKFASATPAILRDFRALIVRLIVALVAGEITQIRRRVAECRI